MAPTSRHFNIGLLLRIFQIDTIPLHIPSFSSIFLDLFSLLWHLRIAIPAELPGVDDAEKEELGRAPRGDRATLHQPGLEVEQSRGLYEVAERF